MQLAPQDVELLLYRVAELEDGLAASIARVEAYRHREHALKAEVAALRLASLGLEKGVAGDESAPGPTTTAAPPAPPPPPPTSTPTAPTTTTQTPIALLLPGRGKTPGAFVAGPDAIEFYEHVARVPRRAFLGLAPAPPAPPPAPTPASTAAQPSGRPAAATVAPLLLPACLNPAPSMGAIVDEDEAAGDHAGGSRRGAAPYFEPISPAADGEERAAAGGAGTKAAAAPAGGGWAARLSGWVNLAAGGGEQQQQQERRPAAAIGSNNDDNDSSTARAAALAAAASAPGADAGATAVWHPMQLPSFSRQDSRLMLRRKGSRRTLSPASSAGGGLGAAAASPAAPTMVPPPPVEVALPGGAAAKAAAATSLSSSSSMRMAPAWQVLWRAPAEQGGDEGDPSAPPLRLAFEASAEARALLQARTAAWSGGGGEEGQTRRDEDADDENDDDAFELAPPRHLAPPLPRPSSSPDEQQALPLPPRLSEPSCVVGPHSVSHPDLWLRGLASALPGRFSRRERWTLLYSTSRDGTALSTLLRKARGCAPTVLLVRDSNGGVFGCYAPEAWRPSPRFYGSGECFVFQLCPHAVYWPWRVRGAKGGRRNDFFQLAGPAGLSVGGGGGRSAIFLDEELLRGSSGDCATSGSPCLASSEEFCVEAVEVWHVGGGGGGAARAATAVPPHEFGGV